MLKRTRGKADPGAKQMPVRFSGEDAKTLATLQERLDQDWATIIRWAIRHFSHVVEAHQWNVNSRGEPLRVVTDSPKRP